MISKFFKKFKSALRKTHNVVGEKIYTLFTGSAKLDDTVLEELEEILILGDVGLDTTQEIIKDLKKEALQHEPTPQGRLDALKSVFRSRFLPHPGILSYEHTPSVILVTGVNGTGKTTSVAKLCHFLQQQGKSVLLAACDTYRAGAIEQLKIWAERLNTPIVAQTHGSDPASVAFDAVESAVAKNFDYVVIDTAGRLHTKTNLMAELNKTKRVIEKKLGRTVDETLLVLDANTGQNGLNQARVFHDTMELSGLILSKLDSSAKGGVALAIQKQLDIPIVFIGTGEKVEHLEEFSADNFTEAFFARDE